MQLYAFDVLALEGDDLRKVPLHPRKNNLARLLARRPDGILSDFEQGEIGPDRFRKACEFGLEGLVSMRRESVYRAGLPRLGQGKEPQAPAMEREGRMPMRYRDVDYTVVQGIGRNIWKWGFAIDGKALAGQAATKGKAVENAERAIDRALTPKKFRLVRPSE